MKNKILTSLVLFILTLDLFAAIPTTEGLFRNNNNSDVSANLIMVIMQVEKDFNQEALEKPESEAPVDAEVVIKEPDAVKVKYNVKYLLSVNEAKNVEVIQVIYKPGELSDINILSVKYFGNLRTEVMNLDSSKALYFSVLSSLTLNRSEEISSLLKKESQTYKTNTELIDSEKKALYQKYKQYLKLVKEDESLKETMENPMLPTDPEVRKTVKAIKERPFLNRDSNVSLEKKDSQFMWKISHDIMEAVFDAKTQRLETLKWGKGQKDLKYSFDEYILFNGTNELPKSIVIDTPEYTYSIRTTSQRQLSLGNKNMRKRYSEYADKLKENSVRTPVEIYFLK